MSAPLSARHWFGKVSAALIMGFVVTLGLSGLLSQAIGVGETYFSTRGQLTMWFMAPVWCGLLSFCFLFHSGRQAWAVLTIAAAAIWLLLFALKAMA